MNLGKRAGVSSGYNFLQNHISLIFTGEPTQGGPRFKSEPQKSKPIFSYDFKKTHELLTAVNDVCNQFSYQIYTLFEQGS